jgi:hypothetical protein
VTFRGLCVYTAELTSSSGQCSSTYAVTGYHQEDICVLLTTRLGVSSSGSDVCSSACLQCARAAHIDVMHHALLTSERCIKYVCCRRQERASVAMTVVCSSTHPQSYCARAAHRDLFSVCVRYDAANDVSRWQLCVHVVLTVFKACNSSGGCQASGTVDCVSYCAAVLCT